MGKLDFEAMRTIRLITMCQSTTRSERSYCSSEMNLRCEAVNVHVILLWGSTVSSGDITQTLARAVIAFLSFKSHSDMKPARSDAVTKVKVNACLKWALVTC